MVYHQSDCFDDSCNYWGHQARKVPPNPVPTFKFTSSASAIATTTTTQEPTIAETVTNLMTDIVTNLVSTTNTPITEISTLSSSTTENTNIILNSTDVLGFNPVNEVTNSNSTTIFNIMESTTSSSIINAIQNGSAPINTTFTITTEGGDNDTILTTISQFASTTVETIMSVMNETSEAPTAMNEDKMQENAFQHHHHHDQPQSNNLLYIILIIIMAMLILIGIILLLIYIRYRKACHRVQNYYEVRPANEKNNSINEGQHEMKDCINDIYVYQQPC